MTPKEQMEFTYEANLPLLRRLAILLLAFSDSDEGDLEDQFEIITASEDDLYDQEASGNDRKSDEEIEREAEEILSTTGNSILRLALSYLHNIEDAEDILQETMIKFVTVRPVFESEAHRKAWLMRGPVGLLISQNKMICSIMRVFLKGGTNYEES